MELAWWRLCYRVAVRGFKGGFGAGGCAKTGVKGGAVVHLDPVVTWLGYEVTVSLTLQVSERVICGVFVVSKPV